MKKMKNDLNKYSYKNKDGEIIITELGQDKLKELEEELEVLEMEYDMTKHDTDVSTQLRLTEIHNRMNVARHLSARIKRGDRLRHSWDNQFAINSHLHILDNSGSTVKEALSKTAEEMGKTKEFVEDVRKRKYPRGELGNLTHTLKHHPVWCSMVENDDINESDLRNSEDLSNQLNKVKRAKVRYEFREDVMARIGSQDERIKILEFDKALRDIMMKNSDQELEPSDYEKAMAWRTVGLSLSKIGEKMGIPKYKVQRLLKK